jgi:hypothetical protein
MEVLQEAKVNILILCSNHTVGYLSKGNKTVCQRAIFTPIFITALFTIGKIENQAKNPTIDD